MNRLPKSFAPYFWDTDFRRLSWKRHAGYIVRRLISVGSADAIEWLQNTIGDEGIRDQIIATKARGLSFERVSNWIPRELYDRWLAEDPNRSIWQPG